MATTRVWIGIALGTALAVLVFDGAGTVGQAQTTMSRAHKSLNSAIDSERRGDYELANTFFQQAQAGQEDLSPAERKELVNGLERIRNALNARRDGSEKLKKVDEAVRANRIQEANALLKEVTANEQFLRGADKQRYKELVAKLQPNTVRPATAGGTTSNVPAPLLRARAQLGQARALMAKGSYEAAEALAKEADALKATYSRDEDTPRKVLDDLAKARATAKQPDAKELLAAARAALAKNELDKAEQLARQADKADSFWSLHLFGDSPAKVLKDVQAAKSKQVLELAKQNAAKNPPTTTKNEPNAKNAPTVANKTETPAPTAPKNSPTPAPPETPKTEHHKRFFARWRDHDKNDKQNDKKPDTAKTGVTPAPTQQVRTPEAPKPAPVSGPGATAAANTQPARTPTQAEIERVKQAMASPRSPSQVKQANSSVPAEQPKTDKAAPPAPTPVVAKPKPETETARQLLKEGRKALHAKDLKKAEEFAKKARDLKPELTWWDDTPDKLLADVQRTSATATAKAATTPSGTSPKTPATPTASTSAKPPVPGAPAATAERKPDPGAKEKTDPRALVKQGRQLYQDGKLDEAKNLALKAAAVKHTSWGLFEDSPEKLLADVHKARVKKDKDESNTVLAESRKLLETANGDLKKLEEAEKLAYRAERLHGPYSVWDLGDRPQKLLAEIESAKTKARKTPLPPLPGSTEVAKAGTPKQIEKPKPAPVAGAGVKPPEPRPTPLSPLIPPQVAGATPRPPVEPRPAPPPPTPPQFASNPVTPPIAPVIPPASVTPPSVPPVMPSIPPTPPPGGLGDDPRLLEARQMLAQSRTCLKNGEFVKAWSLANQVEKMGVMFKPGEDTPAAINREIQQARLAAGSPQQPQVPINDLARQHVRQVIAEARGLQKSGKLVEARAKVLEAQKVGAHLGPDEDSPERALLELNSLCFQKIENLKQEATDNASTAQQDPARLQKAESNLLQARQLASAFGLDVQPIDKHLTWVKDLQMKVGTPPPQVAAIPPVVPPVAQVAPTMPPPLEQARVKPPVEPKPLERGRGMLEAARLELRRGDTLTARRLAEEAFAGGYGVQTEAESLLRQIDIEDFNQRVLTANRSFDSALEAFYRKDYRMAKTILDQLDHRMLKPEKQGKFRELAQMPELQPSSLGLAAQTPSSVKPPRSPSQLPEGVVPPEALPDGGGLQRVDLRPDELQPSESASPDDYAKQVQAMQEIKFQQLREEGLRVQREATDRFQAGETDRALDLLREYLTGLEDVPLEREKQALLKRPIDHRLQQFKTLKAQKDFEEIQKSKTAMWQERQHRRFLAEDEKQKQVADLIKQFNNLFKEGKYREAELAALKARELDPDNTTADAAIYMVKTQRTLMDSRKGRDSRASILTDGLNDVEDQGPYAGDENPLLFDRDRHEIARKREGVTKGILNHLKSDKEREIERRLELPISIEFKDKPLREVIEDLHEMTGINIVPDTKAMEDEAISLERPVTLKVDQVSRRSVLNILLKKVDLTYVVKDEVLQITTPKHAQGKLMQKTYPVADLVIPIDNHAISAVADMTQQLSQGNHTRNLNLTGPTPFAAPPPAPNPGHAGSMSEGAAGPDYQPQNTLNGAPMAGNRAPGQTQTIQDMLIKLITNTIAPTTWSDVGGPGTIDYFPLGMALIINQTPDVQEQVAELLDALRRLQDLQVAVEIRMISLEEAFFERIGLDFNLNIKTDHYTLPWENQIVTQQFKPPGLINDFSPAGRFVAGLTPAGFPGPSGQQAPFTSDLDIPIRNSSFGMAIPPFGGFPNIPGANGGLSLGLAFLSDIQVFMFLEAAQGDRRTNIMQAPKLTLFNGQTSTIQIQDFQFFTTTVQVVQVGGQVVFLPQNQPIPLGINLAIQAVVSADRRFVRMNLAPTMTNLASATVPLFPVTTFITPVFEGGAQGQPIPFTQFMQQPTFTFVNIQTTVSVPDGGTVLIGGLKLMNEGRNEFGPPILSKVPWLNRLFKNVGYGRDTSSLLFMVTPRIIINYEEEELQTGERTLPPAAQ